MPPAEVFLCHSSQDGDFTARLAATLRAHGVPVWYSATNILGAQLWHDEIGTALKRCDWFLLVLSPSAVESSWVKLELMFALNQPRFMGRIVPALLGACDHSSLSWTLSAFQIIDFSRSFEAGCRQLLRAWGLGFASSESAP